MVKPERRTRTDFAVVAAIVVAVLLAGAAAWNFSSARKTVSETGPAPSAVPTPLVELPAALRPIWEAEADRPALSMAGGVVTARGGEVSGLDPLTGKRNWRYQRDRDTCGLTSNAGLVLAYYPDARGCGEITALDPGTGQRKYTRSGQQDAEVNLASDGSYVVTQGPRRVDVFRSDLVLTVQYGRPDVPVNTGVQPRSGCTIGSALPASPSVVILESCPTEPNPRLTVIGSAPKDADRPQETSSVVAPALGTATTSEADAPRLLTASREGAVAYVPAHDGQPARVVTVGYRGDVRRSVDITTPPGGAPRDVPVVAEAGIASFYTGTSTVVIDTTTLAAEMVIPGTLGPGALVGGQIVVPGPTALASYDLIGRNQVRLVTVDRPGYTGGPVLLTLAGQSLVAQWGTRVQAYAAA